MFNEFRVPIKRLKKRCSEKLFNFKTTLDIKDDLGIIGQERAMRAIKSGLSINKKGYNIFASGLVGTGKNSYSEIIANEFSNTKEAPCDWCYVYNFKNKDKPKVIKLNNGEGRKFKNDIKILISRLSIETVEVFKSKEFEERKNSIYRDFEKLTEDYIKELNKIAEKYNFKFQEIDNELISYPLLDNKPMTEEELENLDEDEINKIKEDSLKLSSEAYSIINKIKSLDGLLKIRIKNLKETTAYSIIESNISKLEEKYKSNEDVKTYLNELKDDILKNIDIFIKKRRNTLENEGENNSNLLTRYEVNLFIDNSSLNRAPVIKEYNPTYYNLLGKIEYTNQLGNLKTDHTKIKPGSMHKANGGYLIINANDLLLATNSWEGLKRALLGEKIIIENITRSSIVSEGLSPEPIPLDVKIILVGDNYTYQLLYYFDNDFKKLFRIKADFDDEIERNEENELKFASFVAKYANENNLKPFDVSAITKLIEHSSRLAEDQNKLTAIFSEIVEILIEADSIANFNNDEVVSKNHIEKAILEKTFRNNMYEEKFLEYIKNETLLIETSGRKIGQINGLSVIDLGQYSFGRPCKITASTFIGNDGVINIEREAEKSGSLHDKGVHILTGFLGDRFARKKPLALSASITFEQSYSLIDGDSASSTELYAILSSLSEVPIKQNIAVTGSVNQKGLIQPIGGVNEKIEGFFKTCKTKGFNGGEGVIIPYQNINNLMLSDEVIEYVEKGLFTIYAVKTIEEGIEILTDVKAGEMDECGNYQEGTLYHLVQNKLDKYANYYKNID